MREKGTDMDTIVKVISTKGILTKSNIPKGGYSVNPYVGCEHKCKYCYASFMRRFTNHHERWGDFVDVKYWQPIKDPKKYAGEELFLGSATDVYQPLEEKYQRTKAILEEMRGSGCNISIATKSDLVLRDIDLIRSFPDPLVAWSINTLDEEFRKDMDRGVTIERRLAAMKRFHDAGVKTCCFISPIFPGITDVAAIIRRVRNQCNWIWLENLNLRGDYRPTIFSYIEEKYPQLIPLYDAIYRKRDRTYWAILDDQVRQFAEREGMLYIKDDEIVTPKFSDPPIIVNYFFHEEIKPSAKRKGD